MIVLVIAYCAGMFFLLRHLDRRQKAAQRLREAAYLQRSTGLLA